MAGEKVTTIPKLLKDASQRQYLPGEQLGTGGFATCWRTRMVDRREAPESDECALKAVRAVLPKNIAWRFKLELAIQSKLHHPNVVELYRAFTCDDVTYIALELCPNGSLTDMIKKRKFLTMGEIRRMLIQLCGAVKYLHGRDVVHRDIKAGNIFLDEEMNVKLGDFGLAAIMEPGNVSEYARRTTFCGTPNYLAPEILSKANGHGISVDIWAIGVLAYYLAVGRAPFSAKTKEEIYEKLRKGEYSWPELAPEQNEIPEDLRNLVASLLVEESKRPTPDQIVEHQFFTRGFIPSKLDPLCRTRRPRYARIGTLQENARTYEALCRSSRVGVFGNQESGKIHRKKSKSVAIALAEEYAQGVKLEIPLKEGIVYLGQRSPVSTAIYQDKAERQSGVLPEPSTNVSQAGILTERMVNRTSKMPKHDQMKVPQRAVVEIYPDQNDKIQPIPAGGQRKQSPRKEKRQPALEQKHDPDNSVVFVSQKSVSTKNRVVEQENINPVPLPKEDNGRMMLEAVLSKSKNENPASYRLKVERNVPLQRVETPASIPTAEVKPSSDIQEPAITTQASTAALPPNPKSASERLRDVLDRPQSRIVTRKQPDSPRQELCKVLGIPPPTSPSIRAERMRPVSVAALPQPTTEAPPIAKPQRAGTTASPQPSTGHPAHAKPATSTSTSRTVSTSHNLSQSPSAPQVPTSTTALEPQPPRRRNPSAALAAAAAAAAMTTASTSTNTQLLAPPISRSRTLGRSTRQSRPLSYQPATNYSPTDENVKNALEDRAETFQPTAVPARATTLRAPRRGPRALHAAVAEDEKVMEGVEREIAERLRLVGGGGSSSASASVSATKDGAAPPATTETPAVGSNHASAITQPPRRSRTLRAQRPPAAAVFLESLGFGGGTEAVVGGTVRGWARPRRAGVNYGVV